MFNGGNLSNALSYLYDRPVSSVSSIEVCHIPSGEWQRSGALGRKGTCVEEEHDWVFRYPEAVSGPGYVPAPLAKDMRVAKSQIVTITINPDGSVSSNPMLEDYRKNLLNGETTVALRYRGVLAKRPWSFNPIMFEDQKTQDGYRWDFGDWWSLELPTRGSGWREAEWKVNSFHHQASAWKTQEKSSLYFDFLSTSKYYLLRGKFDIMVNDAIRSSLKIRINNKELTYRWISDGKFEAEIPLGVMINGINEIEFNSSVDPKYYGLSARLDWFEIQKSSVPAPAVTVADPTLPHHQAATQYSGRE